MTDEGFLGQRPGLAEAASPPDAASWADAGAAPHVIPLGGQRRPPPSGDATTHVLLVSADEEDRRIVPELLARAGRGRFRLDLVVDAEAGLKRLTAGQHDVALIDCGLPGGQGLGLVRQAARLGVAAPMIALSGLATPDLEEAIAAGAADFLDKEELDTERLERAIRASLARQRRGARLAGGSGSPAARPGMAPHPDAAEAGPLPALAEAAAGRGDLARELAQALEAGEIVACFQPQVALRAAEPGLTALPRWRHRSLGVVEGRELMLLAEAVGLIEPLTDWLIDTACRQARSWCQDGFEAAHVGVPVPWRRKLAWSGLAQQVEARLAAAGLPADRLELELDERLLLEELEGGMRAVSPLRDLGARLAVSGFGAGATSLAVLRDMPLRTVKLGRALIEGATSDRRRAVTAGAVMALAQALGLRVVAEGVESQAQLQWLKAEGCDAAQSPLTCPPLPAEACTGWLRLAARRG